MFEIIGTVNMIESNGNCIHISERTVRVSKANELIAKEHGTIIECFEVNKGHKNGNEIHVIYNNGIIRIYNVNTKKHITDLIARKAQIERYGVKVTKCMEKKIKSHINAGYNMI
jgi:hypothetical protein